MCVNERCVTVKVMSANVCLILRVFHIFIVMFAVFVWCSTLINQSTMITPNIDLCYNMYNICIKSSWLPVVEAMHCMPYKCSGYTAVRDSDCQEKWWKDGGMLKMLLYLDRFSFCSTQGRCFYNHFSFKMLLGNGALNSYHLSLILDL